MAKLLPFEDGYTFLCPGCGFGHGVWTKQPNGRNGAVWSFNGDLEKPTFSPSLLVQGTRRITDDEATRILAGENLEIPKYRCHSFIRDGNIQFLNDCTHALAGQTVPIPEYWDD